MLGICRIVQDSGKYNFEHCGIRVNDKINEPGHEKMCLMQYAHPRSLISAFVIRCQDRMIPLVYISETSRF